MGLPDLLFLDVIINLVVLQTGDSVQKNSVRREYQL